MRRVRLRGTDLTVSAVGFGCVGLTMHADRRSALAMLEQAYALGITHYDVAPVYGFGEAERILGEFLRGKRDSVTVTTKFGLQPSAAVAKYRGLISLARKIAHQNALLQRLAAMTKRAAVKADSFDAADAEVSLQNSLRALNTDHIDLFLLHEAGRENAVDERLLNFVETQVGKGALRHAGVGGSTVKIGESLSSYPKAYRVFQFEHTLLSPHARSVERGDRGVITFGAARAAVRLTEELRRRPDLVAEAKERFAIDLLDEAIVRRLSFQEASDANPDGAMLFSTTNAEHLRRNVNAVDAERLPGELVELCRRAGQPS